MKGNYSEVFSTLFSIINKDFLSYIVRISARAEYIFPFIFLHFFCCCCFFSPRWLLFFLSCREKLISGVVKNYEKRANVYVCGTDIAAGAELRVKS